MQPKQTGAIKNRTPKRCNEPLALSEKVPNPPQVFGTILSKKLPYIFAAVFEKRKPDPSW